MTAGIAVNGGVMVACAWNNGDGASRSTVATGLDTKRVVVRFVVVIVQVHSPRSSSMSITPATWWLSSIEPELGPIVSCSRSIRAVDA
jgi:hypothetical protein